MTDLPVNSLLIALIAIVTTIAILTLALAMITLLKQNEKVQRYNFDMNRAALSADREFYERQIAKTNLQMTAAEDRWKDANHLLISHKNLTGIKSGKPNSRRFLSGFGIYDVDIDPRLVMILTPFSSDEDSTFEAIKETCTRANLTAVRGDEQFMQGDILAHVVNLIVRSRLVIANISSRNANVFYELGIAQALNKPVILVSKSLADTPFDLQNNRIIVYRDERDLRNKLTDSLLKLMADPSINSENNEVSS